MKICPVDDQKLGNTAARFAALGSPQRLQVLRCLVRAGTQGVSIGVLGTCSGITGSTLTHHMKILVEAGLATQTRDGRSMICAAVSYDELKNLSEFLLEQCCADCSSEEGVSHG